MGEDTTSARGPAPIQLRLVERTSALVCTLRRPFATRTHVKVARSHPCSCWPGWWWEQGTSAKDLRDKSETPPVGWKLFCPFSKCLLSQGKRRHPRVQLGCITSRLKSLKKQQLRSSVSKLSRRPKGGALKHRSVQLLKGQAFLFPHGQAEGQVLRVRGHGLDLCGRSTAFAYS